MSDIKLKILPGLGFKGDIAWIHNEEGSGARYYNCSVYYPDSMKNPSTNSGITIDPGIDLANANKGLIKSVLKIYMDNGILSRTQYQLLQTSFGLKKSQAIQWIKKNKIHFKGSFLVPDNLALTVMESEAAPKYWNPLIRSLPELFKIDTLFIASAVHTALLSLSYNRGPLNTIEVVGEYVRRSDWLGLAKEIRNIPQIVKSLKARRKREADLISKALEMKKEFIISIDRLLKPLPLTSIPSYESEFVLEQLEIESI